MSETTNSNLNFLGLWIRTGKLRILFSGVWDGVDHQAKTKIVRDKVQNDIHTSKFIQTSGVLEHKW